MTAPSHQVLMEQAPSTIDYYLSEAIDSIDKKFGKGFAAKNPALVAVFIKASCMDYCAAALCKTIEETF